MTENINRSLSVSIKLFWTFPLFTWLYQTSLPIKINQCFTNTRLRRHQNRPVFIKYRDGIADTPATAPNTLLIDQLSIFGNDYPTVDGTGVRDFIHVTDLAAGHVAALNYLENQTPAVGFLPINLGTGKGTSVLELVTAFSEVSGKDIPFQFVARRAGDIASCYASADKAKELLRWQASLSITDMCQDSWRWQSMNPNGYNPA